MKKVVWSILVVMLCFGTALANDGGKKTDKSAVNLQVYPNPVTAQLVVALESGKEISRYEIRDLLGRLMATGIHTATKELVINITGIPPGTYFISAYTATGVKSTTRFKVSS